MKKGKDKMARASSSNKVKKFRGKGISTPSYLLAHGKSPDEIKKVLKATVFFDNLTNLVPAHHYLNQKDAQDVALANTAGGSKGSGQKKVLWYHPSIMTSTTEQIRQAVENDRKNNKKAGVPSGKRQRKTAAERKEAKAKKAAGEGGKVGGREALLARLHSKIEEMKKERRLAKEEKKNEERRRKESKKSESLSVKRVKGEEEEAKEVSLVQQNKKRKREEEEGGSKKEVVEDFSFNDMTFKKSGADTTIQLLEGNKAGSKMKKLKKAIEKIEQEKEEIGALKGEEAEKEKKRLAMSRALQKADGVKVKDNLSKLKKAQKALLRRKAMSEKKWRERKDSEKEAKEAKQDRREQNLEARSKKDAPQADKPKESTRASRAAEAKKKAHRPGFEGKKGGVLQSS